MSFIPCYQQIELTSVHSKYQAKHECWQYFEWRTAQLLYDSLFRSIAMQMLCVDFHTYFQRTRNWMRIKWYWTYISFYIYIYIKWFNMSNEDIIVYRILGYCNIKSNHSSNKLSIYSITENPLNRYSVLHPLAAQSIYSDST